MAAPYSIQIFSRSPSFSPLAFFLVSLIIRAIIIKTIAIHTISKTIKYLYGIFLKIMPWV
jgi:hypothetical protein